MFELCKSHTDSTPFFPFVYCFSLMFHFPVCRLLTFMFRDLFTGTVNTIKATS